MNLWNSFAGQLTVMLTSADPSGFLESVNHMGIAVRNVRYPDELTVSFTLSRHHVGKVRKLAEKRGEELSVRHKSGLFWTAAALAKRPVLTGGLIFLLLMTFFLPTRVLFVRVEGNAAVPSRQILAAAEECGIRFGASRRTVRSEKVKNALLSVLPELQWAGVNTAGCVATISLRERVQTSTRTEEEGVSSIVACRDGVILSCTAAAGTLQCSPGQAVREGQVLISGYTDCGILIRADRAEGEVYGSTRHEITAITPEKCLRRGQRLEQHRNFSLIIGKKRINLWNGSGICDTTCGRMYEEYYIYLPGGFALPIALAVDTHSCWETVSSVISQEEAEKNLASFAESCVLSRTISGQILLKRENLSAEEGVFRLEGEYLCREMIGRHRQERKVVTNGKSG